MIKRIIIVLLCILSLSSFYIGCTETPVTPSDTVLEVSDFQQTFTAPFGGPSPSQLFFNITSSTGQVINYKISHSASWLQVVNSNQLSFGLTPDSILLLFRVVTPNMLPYGTYYDTISITTDSVSQEIIKREIILHIGSQITSNPTSFEYSVNVNGNNPASQDLHINSSTIIDFDVTLTNSESWLQVSSNTYNTGTNSPIPISILSTSLSAGTYADTIWVSSDSALNSPYGIPVKVFVKPWLKQQSPRNNNINNVFFNDAQNGWAVGDIVDNSSRAGFIIKTVDGGENWDEVRFFPGTNVDDSILVGISFVNNHGWAIGTNGIILHSSDNGDTWTSQTAPSGMKRDFKDVEFISADSGWIVGDSGTVLATSDGGQTWNLQSVPRNPQNDSLVHALTGISFLDNLHGWICGLTDIILVTSDGGQTWEQQTVPPGTNGSSYDFQEITFSDNLHGWAIGKLGLIVTTLDGGNTWSYKQLPEALGLLSIYFVNSTDGWISGQNGLIYNTTDGGLVWNLQTIESNSSLQSIFMTNQNDGWVVGGEGSIYHTTSGGKNQ